MLAVITRGSTRDWENDKDIYVWFENKYVIPTSMDDETYLRYIDSLGIKRGNQDVLELKLKGKNKKKNGKKIKG